MSRQSEVSVMSEPLPNLKRRPLGQEVHAILRRMIQRGELAPGERLVEERLAGQLGLSRTPVREALLRLAQEGLLTRHSRGGYEVRPLTREEVEEAIGVRAVLESYAAELAARRVGPEGLAEIGENLADFQKALDARDEEWLLQLNSDFHDLVYRAAASKLLYRLLSELQDEVERISRVLMSNMPAGEWSIKDHQELLDALGAHDPARAAELSRRHVLRAADHLLAITKQQTPPEGEEPA